MKHQRKKSHLFIYRTSLFFTLIYFFLIYFQKRILTFLFQTQLSFSLPDTLFVLTSENKLEDIIERAQNGALTIGIFLTIETLLFIGVIILLLTKLFILYKKKKWQTHDYILLIGLIILLLGSFYYSYIAIDSTFYSYTEVKTIVERISPKQLASLSKQWSGFFYNYDFSALNFVKDSMVISDQFSLMVKNINEVGRIPDIINLWLNHLNLLKTHYFLLMCFGFISILIAHFFNYRSNGSLFKSKKSIQTENSVLKAELLSLKKTSRQRAKK